MKFLFQQSIGLFCSVMLNISMAQLANQPDSDDCDCDKSSITLTMLTINLFMVAPGIVNFNI